MNICIIGDGERYGYEKRNTEKQGRGGSSAGGFDNCQGNFLYVFKTSAGNDGAVYTAGTAVSAGVWSSACNQL